MVLMMMMMMVMMVSVEGQNVMKVRAELGKDVSLNCSITTKDIFWFVQLYSQISAGIGRVYYPDVSLYFTPDYESKYLLLKNRLVIKNFTADDCRSYFCAEMKNHYYIFVDSFLLDSDVRILPHTNTSVHDVQEVRGQAAVIYHSVLVGVLLLSLVAGFLISSVKKQKVSRRLDGAAAFT